MVLCSCGRVARFRGKCVLCYKKEIEVKHIEKLLKIKPQAQKSIEGHELEYNLRRLFKQMGMRPIQKKGFQIIVDSTKIVYTCSKCNTVHHSSRYFIDGLAYCRKCAGVINDLNKTKEQLAYAEAQGRLDVLDPLGDLRKQCTKLGTCDVLHFHHDLLKDDPERLSTEFMISLICGNTKLKKYKSKKEARALIQIT